MTQKSETEVFRCFFFYLCFCSSSLSQAPGGMCCLLGSCSSKVFLQCTHELGPVGAEAAGRVHRAASSGAAQGRPGHRSGRCSCSRIAPGPRGAGQDAPEHRPACEQGGRETERLSATNTGLCATEVDLTLKRLHSGNGSQEMHKKQIKGRRNSHRVFDLSQMQHVKGRKKKKTF